MDDRIDLDLETKDNLLKILDGIRETRAHILSKYGVSSKEELLLFISKSKVMYWDASIDILRLDILSEMEKSILETLEKSEGHGLWNGISGFMKRFNLFKRTSVKEAMT